MAQDPNGILQAVQTVASAIESTPGYISRIKYNGSISQALRISDVMKDQADTALVSRLLAGPLSQGPLGMDTSTLSRTEGFFENVVEGVPLQGKMLRQFKMGAHKGQPGPYLYLLTCACCWLAMDDGDADATLISQWIADMIPDLQANEMPSFLRLITEVSQWIPKLVLRVTSWHSDGADLVRAGMASPLYLWMIPGVVFSTPQTLLAAADHETELAVELLSNAGLLPFATSSTHGNGVYCRQLLNEGGPAGIFKFSGETRGYDKQRLEDLGARDGVHHKSVLTTTEGKTWAKNPGIGKYAAILIETSISSTCKCQTCWEFCVAFWLRSRQARVDANIYGCGSVTTLNMYMTLLAKQWAQSVGLVRSGLLRRDQAEEDLVMWQALYEQAHAKEGAVGIAADGDLLLIEGVYGKCLTGKAGPCLFRPIFKQPLGMTHPVMTHPVTITANMAPAQVSIPTDEDQKEVTPDDQTGPVRIWAELQRDTMDTAGMKLQFRGKEVQVFPLMETRTANMPYCPHSMHGAATTTASSGWSSLDGVHRPRVLLTHNNAAARIMGVVKAAAAGLEVVVQGHECLNCCLRHGQLVVDGLSSMFNGLTGEPRLEVRMTDEKTGLVDGPMEVKRVVTWEPRIKLRLYGSLQAWQKKLSCPGTHDIVAATILAAGVWLTGWGVLTQLVIEGSSVADVALVGKLFAMDNLRHFNHRTHARRAVESMVWTEDAQDCFAIRSEGVLVYVAP